MVYQTVIEKWMRGDRRFLGCFPRDMLPPFPSQFPKTMIINTHDSYKPGEHWLGLVLLKNRCFYFDSFGVGIIDPYILSYLGKYKKVIYSNICIQHNKSVKCGQFCTAFIKSVNSKQSYQNFISSFNHVDLLSNDVIVKDYILK